MLSSVLFIAVAALTGVEAVETAGQCTATESHLAVSTRTNASGHWTTTLRLDRETRLPGRETAMFLDVRPMTSRCRGVRADTLVVTLEGPPPPPGPGYTMSQGFGYYKVHTKQVFWEEAKVACEAEDAHLVVLNSAAEASAVQQLIKATAGVSSHYVHVGFNDKVQEGRYVTIFGETLAAAGYDRWDQGAPNKGRNGNCGCMKIDTMGFHDDNCSDTHKFGFVCEQLY